MLGLPGESSEMMMETATQVAAWDVDSVKLHNLYVVHRTELVDQVQSGKVRLLELSE